MNLFTDFQIHSNIIKAINQMGFEEPSPIQQACIPAILKGKDVIGQAQTGTGKTAAFGIPMVQIVKKIPDVQGLVLTPTRELAIQVSEELGKIAKYKGLKILPIYGGQSIGHQIRALKQGAQIIIGTPGRVLDHIRKKTLQLNDISLFVLDEADEMLDMGFIDDIEEIIRNTPNNRQTLLFSATMPDEIRRLANSYLKNPELISVNRGDITVPLIQQVYYKVLENNKLDSLCRIIDHDEVDLGIVFCRTKKTVDFLTSSLQDRGYLVAGLHGDLSQNQRDSVMKLFRENTIEFLIATDVAARGIDVDSVTHVINYDIPQDPESYVHRIGRTGRAGKRGIALTLVTPREIKQLRTIEQEINTKITPKKIPTLEEVKNIQQKQWKKQIIDYIDNNQDSLDDFNLLLEELSQNYSYRDIASATLQLAFYDKFISQNAQDSYDFGETGASPGMVRFFMNIGRNIEMSPKEIVKIISEQIDIPVKSIGKIKIFDRFSFVEVPEDLAPFVYEGLRYSLINGYRLILEPARPKN